MCQNGTTNVLDVLMLPLMIIALMLLCFNCDAQSDWSCLPDSVNISDDYPADAHNLDVYQIRVDDKTDLGYSITIHGASYKIVVDLLLKAVNTGKDSYVQVAGELYCINYDKKAGYSTDINGKQVTFKSKADMKALLKQEWIMRLMTVKAFNTNGGKNGYQSVIKDDVGGTSMYVSANVDPLKNLTLITTTNQVLVCN